MATDVYDVKDDFRRQNIPSETFAVPYGDHGQNATDPRIPHFVDELLATQFRVVFVQSPGNDPRYTRPDGAALRYEVHTDTSADALRAWLVRHNPGSGGDEGARARPRAGSPRRCCRAPARGRRARSSAAPR